MIQKQNENEIWKQKENDYDDEVESDYEKQKESVYVYDEEGCGFLTWNESENDEKNGYDWYPILHEF